MPSEGTKRVKRGGEVIPARAYRCFGCAGCPLAPDCLGPKTKHGRMIMRDAYEEARQRTAARMSSEAGRQLYSQRPRIAETPFAIINSMMGFRHFLLRGLEKVKTEQTQPHRHSTWHTSEGRIRQQSFSSGRPAT